MATLIMLRHGQSAWNAENRFTGWVDVDLDEVGEQEARRAGEVLGDQAGRPIDVVFTSVLTRAVHTADLALNAAGRSFVPVHRHWRLNERHYGALTGLNKKETADLHGAEQVMAWRRGYRTPPPPMSLEDPNNPSRDPRYASVPPRMLPSSECLADVVDRMLPYFADAIAPELLLGRTVLVVAHGNSLRGLLKYLEDVDDEAIADIDIPTGFPRRYELDASLGVTSVEYLGDQEAVQAAAAAVRAQAG